MEVEKILKAILSDDIAMKFKSTNEGPYIPEVFATQRKNEIAKVKRWLDSEVSDVQKEIIIKRAKQELPFSSIANNLSMTERKAKMIYESALLSLDINLKKKDSKEENKLGRK